MKPEWKHVYLIEYSNKVIEVDRPTGAKREIIIKPLEKPFDREVCYSGGRITYRRKEQ